MKIYAVGSQYNFIGRQSNLHIQAFQIFSRTLSSIISVVSEQRTKKPEYIV